MVDLVGTQSPDPPGVDEDFLLSALVQGREFTVTFHGKTGNGFQSPCDDAHALALYLGQSAGGFCCCFLFCLVCFCFVFGGVFFLFCCFLFLLLFFVVGFLGFFFWFFLGGGGGGCRLLPVLLLGSPSQGGHGLSKPV